MSQSRYLSVTSISYVNSCVQSDVLSTFFPSDGHTGCLQLLAAIHNAVINILENSPYLLV